MERDARVTTEDDAAVKVEGEPESGGDEGSKERRRKGTGATMPPSTLSAVLMVQTERECRRRERVDTRRRRQVDTRRRFGWESIRPRTPTTPSGVNRRNVGRDSLFASILHVLNVGSDPTLSAVFSNRRGRMATHHRVRCSRADRRDDGVQRTATIAAKRTTPADGRENSGHSGVVRFRQMSNSCRTCIRRALRRRIGRN
jgi:hypothetical protein